MLYARYISVWSIWRWNNNSSSITLYTSVYKEDKKKKSKRQASKKRKRLRESGRRTTKSLDCENAPGIKKRKTFEKENGDKKKKLWRRLTKVHGGSLCPYTNRRLLYWSRINHPHQHVVVAALPGNPGQSTIPTHTKKPELCIGPPVWTPRNVLPRHKTRPFLLLSSTEEHPSCVPFFLFLYRSWLNVRAAVFHSIWRSCCASRIAHEKKLLFHKCDIISIGRRSAVPRPINWTCARWFSSQTQTACVYIAIH